MIFTDNLFVEVIVNHHKMFEVSSSTAPVMDGTSSLQVLIRTPIKKQSSKKKSGLPLTPGHRPAMSECDCESRRNFKFSGFDAIIVEDAACKSSVVAASQDDLKSSVVAASQDDLKGKNCKFDSRSTISEMDIGKWENGGGSEFDYDV
ncbi:hypothetical protein CR513_29032, partial [Mucuna pruriens]